MTIFVRLASTALLIVSVSQAGRAQPSVTAGTLPPRAAAPEPGATPLSSSGEQTGPVAMNGIEVKASPLTTIDTTALKLPVTLQEIPRGVSVLEADDFRERNFQRVQDTFSYIPGFSAFGVNEDTYRFYSRGYNMGPDDTRFDGFAGYAVDMTQSPSLFGIERVVYLRGPAGLLYGATTLPGGIINLVSKKPKPSPFTTIDARYQTYAGHGLELGTHNSRSVEVDTNHALTSDGTLLYRLDAIVDERAFFNDGILDHHRGFLAAVTWKSRDDRFSFTPLFDYQSSPFAYGRGFALSPSTSLSTTDGRTGPVNTSDLSPYANYLSGGVRELVQRNLGFDVTAALTPAWHVQAGYRYLSSDAAQYQFVIQPTTLRQLSPTDPRSWVIDRRQIARETYRRNHGIDLQTTYETTLLPGTKNLSQLGWNGRAYRTVRERSAATQPTNRRSTFIRGSRSLRSSTRTPRSSTVSSRAIFIGTPTCKTRPRGASG